MNRRSVFHARSLDALITVNVEPPAAGVQQEVAARGGVATVEPPPDEADVPHVQNGEATSVEAFLDTGVGTNEEASAGFPRPFRPRNEPTGNSRATAPVRVHRLHQVRQSVDETAADEHFDRAQYHLRDGDETAAMVELKMAAQAFAPFTALNARRRGRRDVRARLTALSAGSSTMSSTNEAP